MNPCYGVVASLIVLVPFAIDAKEPVPEIPYGEQEYSQTGEYPREYDISELIGGRKAAFPTWTGMHPKWASVIHLTWSVDPRPSPPNGVRKACLFLYPGVGAGPVESSLHAGPHGSSGFVFANETETYGNVIPLFGQLYCVGSSSPTLGPVIERITEQVPEELRPVPFSRIISRACRGPTLFWEQDASGDRYDFDRVHIVEIAEDTRIARIELIPCKLENSTSVFSEDRRKPLAGQVKKGDLLSARGRAYRVLNVVPRQTIEGTLYELVGWIELSADPVTPTEDDTIAALVEVDEVSWPPRDYRPPKLDDTRRLAPWLTRLFHNPMFWIVAATLPVALLLAIYKTARALRKWWAGRGPKKGSELSSSPIQ